MNHPIPYGVFFLEGTEVMMTQEMINKLRNSVIITDDWIKYKFDEDALYFYNRLLSGVELFKDLSPDRQLILIELSFMGLKRIDDLFDHILNGDYREAALAILGDELTWSPENNKRAILLAKGLEDDSYPL